MVSLVGLISTFSVGFLIIQRRLNLKTITTDTKRFCMFRNPKRRPTSSLETSMSARMTFWSMEPYLYLSPSLNSASQSIIIIYSKKGKQLYSTIRTIMKTCKIISMKQLIYLTEISIASIWKLESQPLFSMNQSWRDGVERTNHIKS